MNDPLKKMVDRYKNTKIKEQTKVREILQQMALLGLERHGFFEKAAFYGGTALRILYGLDRFSEDLDFTLLKPEPNFAFKPFLDGLQRELASLGFEMEVSQKEKNIETSVLSAFMKMNTLKLYLAVGEEKKTFNYNEKVQIKLEIDIDPPPDSRVENRLVLNPFPFYVITLHKSDLFAGKMHALLYRAWKGRVKGRDWYDFIWYIQNQVPLGLGYLDACMKQAGNLPKDEKISRDRLIDMLQDKIPRIDWESAKADVRAFITDPERLEIWSSEFFLQLSEHLLVE